MKPSIAAIVVTHNRISLLKENIAALRAQTHKPDEIIVINNASTDGTSDWLKTQNDLIVIEQGDVGASGGAFSGIKAAYGHGYDWFWCMDDDCIPDRDALEQLLKCSKAEDARTGFLVSLARWVDGKINLMAAPNIHLEYETLLELFPQGLLRVDSASFIGIMFHRRAVEKVGLPLREMYLWYFDDEYTRRISDEFLCYQVLASKVEHRSKTNGWVDFNNLADLRFEHLLSGVRNFVFLRRWHASSKFIGWFRCIKSALKMQLRVWQQISGAKKWKLSAAVWHGVFFNPKIEMPE